MFLVLKKWKTTEHKCLSFSFYSLAISLKRNQQVLSIASSNAASCELQGPKDSLQSGFAQMEPRVTKEK